MSFTKEKLEHSSSIMSQHLVCGDSFCRRISDPFTNRIVCRCYSGTHTNPMNMAPNFSAPFFHTSGEIPSPVSSPLQPNPSMRWDAAVLPTGIGFGAPYTTMTTAQQNIDNILRSQMYSYVHAGLDHNSGRRKNATRETTAALKAWLKEHRKNPYPTKAEKIMLAIITRMTLTQVSTWFANARRRLKKENKGEFSSDTSFDNISTSSDDEDSSKSESLYKTDNIFRNEAATPEHELPGYSSMTNTDIYNFASFTFPSSRPLTSTPIDHNMNNLPIITKEVNEHESTSYTLENDNSLTISTNTTKENNVTSSTIDLDSKDGTSKEENRVAARPMFLPPLISKPKIWSITNIIGSDETKEQSDDNER